jgi:shikimate dehydrogenase
MAFDLVYLYPQTSFMRAALSAGARAANGLGMLLHQGARAFEIWTGRQPSASAMRRALEAEVYGRR